VHELAFIDAKKRRWMAPVGTLTDGASIPQLALSVTAATSTGTVLSAAIVHDAYCGQLNSQGPSYRRASWEEVHRMFYEACLALGSSEARAKLMCAAVMLYVPRWDFPPADAPVAATGTGAADSVARPTPEVPAPAPGSGTVRGLGTAPARDDAPTL
jgi:hypothetical protein